MHTANRHASSQQAAALQQLSKMIFSRTSLPAFASCLALIFSLTQCSVDEHAHEPEAQDLAHEPAAEAPHAHEAPSHEPHEDEGSNAIKEVHLSAAQVRLIDIKYGGFERKNLSEVINATGFTKLPPQNQAEVSVQLPGIITSIRVIEGQAVRAGQVLATMKSLAYNNLRLDKEKLVQELSAARLNRDFLKLEFDRQQALSTESITALKTFQKVSAELKLEEAKIVALQNQVGILTQNIQLGGTANSPAINIVAPISGHITEINLTIGASAESGKSLFSIVDNSKMHLDLLVYEKDLFKVKPKQVVRFVLTNQNSQEFRGKVFNVGKSFENDTKSVAVHADILDERQLLIPGMYVNALIDIGSTEVNALPIGAVINGGGRDFIFVARPKAAHASSDSTQRANSNSGDDHAETEFARIEVKKGAAQLGYVQVTPLQALWPDPQIVVEGAFYLQAHLLKSEGNGGAHAH